MKGSFYLSGLIVGILAASFGFTCGMQGQTTADPSLKLHLDFNADFSDGQVPDLSGNGNDGWQFNPTNWISVTNGVFGGTAAQFSYVGMISNDPPRVYLLSQYVGVTNIDGFAFLTNGTISLWVRFDSNRDNAIILLDTGYDCRYANPALASNSWTLGRPYAPYLSFEVYPGAGGSRTLARWPSDTVQPGGATPNYATTAFHLYTVTIDCSTDWAIAYYDGQPYQTNTIGLPWIRIYGSPSVHWLCIGAAAHNGTPQWGDDRYPNAGYMVGRIDDLRIYNRTLSAPEVHALYSGSAFVQDLAILKTNSESIRLYWNAASDVLYQLESEEALDSNSWAPLGSPILGAGGIASFADPAVSAATKFYRVRVLP